MTSTYNEQTEYSVLACVIQGGTEVYNRIEDIVNQGSFWWKPFDFCWKSFKNIRNAQNNIDKITLQAELSRTEMLDHFLISSMGINSIEAIEYLSTFPVVLANAESYANDLVESTANRKLESLSEKISLKVKSGIKSVETINEIDTELGKIATISGVKVNSISTAKDALKDSLEAITNGMNGEGVFFDTGLKFIDDVVGGIGKQRVLMIAAGTGAGKTALASTIINKVAIEIDERKTRKIGWISLEMSKRECINRIIANHTGIPTLRLDKGKLTEKEIVLYKEVIEKIKDAPIFIDDSPEVNYFQLKSKIRKLVDLGCESIIVDQLNLIEPPPDMRSKKEYELFNWGTYRLKEYSRVYDTNIVILHQISRGLDSGLNRGKNVDPQSSDVHGGGDKGVDCVGIIRHYQEKSYINWVKNRIGAKERREVIFDGVRQRFEDSEEDLPEALRAIPQEIISEYSEEE